MKPVNYDELTREERRKVREAYVEYQEGLCLHCKHPLNKSPAWVMNIDLRLFPPNFFKNPVHLHHNHKTGMTIGAVHAYCNAELWQYYGE